MPLPNTDGFAEAPLSASTSDVEWNKMRDQVRGIRQFVANNYQVRGAKGQLPYITDIFLAITTETPCHTGSAYTDARYYLQRAVAPSSISDAEYESDGTGTDDVNVKTDDALEAASVIPCCITATNIAELPPSYFDGADLSNGQGSHLLREGTMVLVFGLRDAATLGKKWYVFNKQPTRTFILISNATKGGTYNGKPYWGDVSTSFDPTSSGALSVSSLFTQGTPSVYLVNMREDGSSSHSLSSSTNPKVFQGELIGNAPDGRPMFAINECQ